MFTHNLDHKLEGTAFKEMVEKVYQVRDEEMNVGRGMENVVETEGTFI